MENNVFFLLKGEGRFLEDFHAHIEAVENVSLY